mgnify:FL=1|jgi:hypothetical protein
MKKYLSAIAVAAMAILMVGCDKPATGNGDNGGADAALAATLEVTDIADNCATIKVTVTSGTATKGKIVKAVRNSEITVDPTKDIQLINWIEQNGVDIALPYTETLTDVSVGNDMFTAVIVYNAEGRAEICKYQVWTPAGDIDGWSTENNPGSLGEIIW